MAPEPKVTFSRQGELPRLPVPDLATTMARWLRSTRPLLTDDEYASTERMAKEFARPGGVGEELDRRLRARAEEKADSSWILDWWNEFAYLRVRCPLPINVSYYFQFAPTATAFGGDQCSYAAALLTATEDIRESVIKCVTRHAAAAGRR